MDDAEGATVQMALLNICVSFAKYFSGEHVDPRKDMLMMSTCTLTLTDEKFMDFLTEINQIAMKYMNTEVCEGSKTRQITVISAPIDGKVM